MLYYDCKYSGLLCWKCYGVVHISQNLMVFKGDWQIQIIFTQSNQYRERVTPFACTLRALS